MRIASSSVHRSGFLFDSNPKRRHFLTMARVFVRFNHIADEILTAFVELERAIHEFAGEFDLVMPCRACVRMKS